jgi:hypothetical protein
MMAVVSALLVGAVGGCSHAIEQPRVAHNAQSIPAQPAPLGSVVQPATEAPAGPAPITEQARAHARAAFAQALGMWGSGHFTEARAMVELGLAVMDRHLPADGEKEALGVLFRSAVFSENGAAFVVGTSETLLVGDAATGGFLGLRVHDYAGSQVGPALSPKASFAVAPSGAELVVYQSKGMVPHLHIAARRDAPFAFIADDKLVTVRLGEASGESPPLRELSLQRTMHFAPAVPKGEASPATLENVDAVEENPVLDDELIVVNLNTGKTEKVLKLTTPPDGGLLRKVASLPPSRLCNDIDACSRFELDPSPIGRRVEHLKSASGMIVASWQGGATTFHRLKDDRLIGAFRSRGERWKPGLVALWSKPPRAAVATSLPNVGTGAEPPLSVTALVDLERGRVIELIDECRWTTGLAFSDDGTKLMVGDLRHACLHDARTGRHLETTDELRPSHGVEDNEQDVAVRSMADGRWFLRTLDGTFGVFDEKTGKTLVRGESRGAEGFITSNEHALYLADFSAGEGQLITFGPAGIERRIVRMAEFDEKCLPPDAARSPEGKRAATLAKVLLESCVVEGFRLPVEFCNRNVSTSVSPQAPQPIDSNAPSR